MGKKRVDKYSPHVMACMKVDRSGIKLTKADAKLMNFLVGVAVKVQERAYNGGSGVCYLKIRHLVRLEELMGHQPERVKRSWALMREEFKNAYPVNFETLKTSINVVRRRIKKGKEEGNAKEVTGTNWGKVS